MVQKPSAKVLMIGLETKDGLQDAIAKVIRGKANVASSKSEVYWHVRMGHCSSDVLERSTQHVKGINIEDLFKGSDKYKDRAIEKSRRQPRQEGGVHSGAARLAEIVHSDIVGPIKTGPAGSRTLAMTPRQSSARSLIRRSRSSLSFW